MDGWMYRWAGKYTSYSAASLHLTLTLFPVPQIPQVPGITTASPLTISASFGPYSVPFHVIVEQPRCGVPEPKSLSGLSRWRQGKAGQDGTLSGGEMWQRKCRRDTEGDTGLSQGSQGERAVE